MPERREASGPAASERETYCTLIDGIYYQLQKNVLGQWHTTDQIIPNPNHTTDISDLFEFKTGSFWIHRDEYVVSATHHQRLKPEVNEAFTEASEINDEVAVDFHNAVKDFEKWQPKTAGEKRFKETVDAIELRARKNAR